ncbi:aldehyde dehydrogenase [Methylovirgula ligni]|uniref:Isoquinoline 1-oxidoreductase beta subunit n=1 Tax=Methylovirgula ligni TaxID=569860 RepID=A0A3D9Z1N1_9HYPH|nr:molybdopterin cofactor-binding domain-containing protein [Methylovirgula ligni]QAY95657.1 aldehyde dehydrogenase [Methylovirgula ligni]REF88981.1 isoquinoline 1-oxidoreductase beta subunit [Methylovirgula ligni]
MGYDMPSRRFVLKAGAAAGGGLLLGLHLPSLARATAAPGAMDLAPNAFVRIDTHGTITLILPHTEFGQGIYTSSAMLMGEELDVGLDQIAVETAPPDIKHYIDPILGDEATGGSVSTRADWVRLREAAAVARTLMVAAAAKRWNVDPATCRVERGVIHDATGRSLAYGDVVSDAAQLPVPANVKLKDPSQFKLIGTSAKRIDTPSKVNGTAIYGIDIIVPNMRFGTVAITPVKGGKLASMDEAAARHVPGVQDVIRNDEGDAVAVIGDHMWAAKQGLEALNLKWDAGENGDVTLETIISTMDRASHNKGVVAKKEGDAAAAIRGAATQLSAIYQSPFLSHSPMEPLNCTLHIKPDSAEIWLGTQVPVRAQKAVAKVAGLPQDKVTVHNQLMGGAFGRRLDIDSVEVAASIAKHVSYPVKLVWTREEDLRHDYYRPYYYDRVAAGLDADGKLVGRTHRVTGPSILARWAPPAFKNGLDDDAVLCAAETPYEIPNEYVDYVRDEPRAMNTSWWRGVGPTHNLFVVESFIDELAHAAKQDPVEFRRGMLKTNPRALAVLNLAAEKSDWGSPLPRGTGRGVELQFAFGSYLCCVLEVEVTPPGEISVRRAVVAIDCGMTVNPDTVQAQIQGGLILGLGTAMYNEITLTGGAIDQSNFHDYRAMRINEAPKIEVYQIRNSEKPGGIGETGTAAAAPALGNAIFAATGKRLRRLPFGRGQLSGT